MTTTLPPLNKPLSRRQLLRQSMVASGVLAVGPGLWSGSAAGDFKRAGAVKRMSNIPKLAGTLHAVQVDNDPDTRMLLPRGFSVREVARTGLPPVASSDYLWHAEPDGGACFPLEDNGWVYVSNAEITASKGGVGALRFSERGDLVDAYAICSGTSNNCAGGPTPWGTWLSCEEVDAGLVYECDPRGEKAAVPCPALGAFKHEAAAVDPVRRHIYLTEDTPDSNLYRFVPDHYPADGRADLRNGRLEVAVVEEGNPLQSRRVGWVTLPNPAPDLNGFGRWQTATRKQVPEATTFDGGEGCWYHQGIVYFTTKGDNRVWALDTDGSTLDLIYDKQSDTTLAIGMADVDNVTVSAGGDVLVAEDGSHTRIVVVGPDLQPFELLTVLGHDKSELCGPAFSPDGTRLYFSSQNGPSGEHRDGRTYEVRGPFFSAA